MLACIVCCPASLPLNQAHLPPTLAADGDDSFGMLSQARNRLDGKSYAVKKVRLKKTSHHDRMLREVTTLARLEHTHIVRYHSAWLELTSEASSNRSGLDASASGLFSEEEETGGSASAVTGGLGGCDHGFSYTLYIQMQLCERNLHDWLRHRNFSESPEVPGAVMTREVNHAEIMRIFQQLLHGLRYIHSNGVLHRDIKVSSLASPPPARALRPHQTSVARRFQLAHALFAVQSIAAKHFLDKGGRRQELACLHRRLW